MTKQQEMYGLDGAIGSGTGQIASANSGHVDVPCVDKLVEEHEIVSVSTSTLEVSIYET